jgi:hypothetical protein
MHHDQPYLWRRSLRFSNLVLELRGVEHQNHAAVGELQYDGAGNITTLPNALAVEISTRAITRATIHAEELAEMLGCDLAPVVWSSGHPNR